MKGRNRVNKIHMVNSGNLSESPFLESKERSDRKNLQNTIDYDYFDMFCDSGLTILRDFWGDVNGQINRPLARLDYD